MVTTSTAETATAVDEPAEAEAGGGTRSMWDRLFSPRDDMGGFSFVGAWTGTLVAGVTGGSMLVPMAYVGWEGVGRGEELVVCLNHHPTTA